MVFVPVIARAYGGEPLKRVAVHKFKGLTYISNPLSLHESADQSGVGFPEKDVFLFDETAFQTLAEQWESNGKTDPQVWARLKRYT